MHHPMQRPSFCSICLFLSATLTGCPSADEPGTGDTDATTTNGGSQSGSGGDTTDGMAPDMDGEMFFAQICAPCHGAQGEGTMLGYEVQHPVRDYSEWVVRHGRPGDEFEGSAMAAYAPSVVNDDTLEEVWDYLDSFPQPTTGEALYLDYCRNCHGIDALGGVTGVNIRESEALAEMLEKVREGEDGSFDARGSYMPAFDSTWLTDAEIMLIHDYVAGL